MGWRSRCRAAVFVLEPDGHLIVPITEQDLAKSLAQLSILLLHCQVESCGRKKMRSSETTLSIWTPLSRDTMWLVLNLRMVRSLTLFS